MDENLKIIEQEIKDFKNTVVICWNKLYILRGNSEDQHDYYYILQNIKGDFEEHSCVGGFISLKNQLTPKEYDRLKNYFQGNLDRLSEIINKEVV